MVCAVLIYAIVLYVHLFFVKFSLLVIGNSVDYVMQAFCGFSTKVIENSRTAVCTGNWGCGAFGGDKQLKCVV